MIGYLVVVDILLAALYALIVLARAWRQRTGADDGLWRVP